MSVSVPALIDTDILSALLRREPAVVHAAGDYLESHERLSFSTITRYEILRGLKAKSAARQQSAFERFCAANSVLNLGDEVISKAAGIYADLYRRGGLIGDADILSAATAITAGYSLATNNERHFSRIEGLHVENRLESA